MSTDFELTEWRRDVYRMSEREREINTDSTRAALGIVGDKYDEMYGGN